MDTGNPNVYPTGDPFQNMPNMESADMSQHFDMNDLSTINFIYNEVNFGNPTKTEVDIKTEVRND